MKSQNDRTACTAQRLSIDDLIARHQAEHGSDVLRRLGPRDDSPCAVELRRPAGKHDVAPCDFHRLSIQITGRQRLDTFEMDRMRWSAPAKALPGTMSFVPVGRSLRAATSGDDFHAVQILIPLRCMRRAAKQVRGEDAEGESRFLGHIGTATSRLYRLAHLAYDVHREPGTGDLAMIDALVQAICVEISRDLTVEKSAIRSGAQLSDVDRACVLNLMEDAVDGSLSLGDIAEELCIEPYRLSRLFQTSYGETPRRYLARLRLTRAQRMLKETNAPLAEIAAACGFSSQAHMTTRFSQQIGTTPARYRAQQ